MKTINFLLFTASLLIFSACGENETTTTSTTTTPEKEPDLTLVVGEELDLNGAYVTANKVFESDHGLSSNIDIADEDVIYGGGLIYKGEQLEINAELYKCSSIDEKIVEFELMK